MHSQRLSGRPLTGVVISLLVASGVAGCQSGAGSDVADDVAEVAAVVDGSTVEVLQGDAPVTVRLLGVMAPAADECLSAESTSALTELLPVGTEIRLDRGEDDDVAVVYAEDVLVNAELVRRGLAFVSADEAGPIADEVGEAEQEAVRTEAGMFGAEAECTVPAQVAALEQAGSAATDAAAALAVGVGLEEVDRHGAALASVVTTGAALAALLDGDTSRRYPSGLVEALKDRTTAVNERLAMATTGVEVVRVAEAQRIEDERIAAEAAAQAAAEAAAAAQAAAEAEAARAAAAAQQAAANAAPAATGGSVYYKNCDAARAAGAAPVLAGQPGYSSKLDRDGDGVGCEN